MAEEEKKGSELAKVEPEVKVLSPVEKAEGDKRFEAKITQLGPIVARTGKHTGDQCDRR